MSVLEGDLYGIVLARDQTGEKFCRVSLFDHRLGLTAAMIRVTGKGAKSSSPPDLFDEVECRLSPSKAGSSMRFLAEHRTTRSFRVLASNPSVFLTAGEISRFYLRNGSHLLDPLPKFHLLRSALDSFSRARLPKVVLLKIYFSFARDEGLPVGESWLANLPLPVHDQIRSTLFRPVDHPETCPDLLVDDAVESIKRWMNSETELLA